MTTFRLTNDMIEDDVDGFDMDHYLPTIKEGKPKKKTKRSKSKSRATEEKKKSKKTTSEDESMVEPEAPSATMDKKKKMKKKQKLSAEPPAPTASIVLKKSSNNKGPATLELEPPAPSASSFIDNEYKRTSSFPSQIFQSVIDDGLEQQEDIVNKPKPTKKKKKKKQQQTVESDDDEEFDEIHTFKPTKKKKKAKHYKTPKATLFDDPEDGSNGSGTKTSTLDVEMGTAIDSPPSIVVSTTAKPQDKQYVYIGKYRRIDVVFGTIAAAWVLIMIVLVASLAVR